MVVIANELRIGNLIMHDGRLLTVTKTNHVKPGKGGAFVQAELKDIKSGTKINERFRSDENIEKVRLDEQEYQFLFSSDGLCTFMDTVTFDQIQIEKTVLGNTASFLQDNMVVKITMHDGEVIGVVLPDTVIMEVVEADAVVKAQTAASSYKPAILENGERIMVPPHISVGTKIVINTSDITYVEKAK